MYWTTWARFQIARCHYQSTQEHLLELNLVPDRCCNWRNIGNIFTVHSRLPLCAICTQCIKWTQMERSWPLARKAKVCTGQSWAFYSLTWDRGLNSICTYARSKPNFLYISFIQIHMLKNAQNLSLTNTSVTTDWFLIHLTALYESLRLFSRMRNVRVTSNVELISSYPDRFRGPD
jgi:hypothetical protein